MKNYHQLTLEQRYQISALLKLGFNKSAIATELEVHKSTIGRKLRRDLSKTGWFSGAYFNAGEWTGVFRTRENRR